MATGNPRQTPQSTLSTPRLVVSPWLILIVVALGFFMILLDTTIVNVAIPSMIDGLHASLDQILWILNAYILVYAVLLISTGRMGDMWGPKRMFMTGLVLFLLASAACGLAQSPTELIVFRVIQGIGGAILTPQSLSIITSIFPPEKRGAAFGVWGAVAGLAAVTGPTLGGFLTTTYSWRAIFYVNVPIGIVAVILASLVMPELTIHREHKLDLLGVVLATAGLFSGVFALIEGQRYKWGRISDIGAFNIGSVHAGLISIWSLLVFSAILLGVFVYTETRAKEPLLPLALFRDRNFSLANCVSAIVAFGMLGLFLPFVIFLQSVRGLTAEEAGVVMVPMSLTSMFIAPLAGRLADRINAKYILFTGLLLFGAGMGMVIKVASLSAVGTTFTLPLIVAGVGMGCTFAPMVAVAMRHIAPTQAGAASGFINTVRQVGGTVGSSVVGAVLQNRLATELRDQAVNLSVQLPPSFRANFVNAFSKAGSQGLQVGRGQTGLGQMPKNVPPGAVQKLQSVGAQVFHHAFLNAMKPSLAIPIAAMVAGALVTLFMEGAEAGAERAATSERPTSEGGLAAAGG